MVHSARYLLCLTLGFAATSLHAQESDEVKRLTERVATLEAKLNLAEKENELLRKEIQLLKAKPSGREKPGSRQPLSDLLPVGKVITGNWRSLNKPNNDGNFGRGTISLTITERDGSKFKADSVITNNQDGPGSSAAVEGVINGQRLIWETVGDATLIKASLVRKGEDSLEGNYQIPTTKDGGTVAFKLESQTE